MIIPAYAGRHTPTAPRQYLLLVALAGALFLAGCGSDRTEPQPPGQLIPVEQRVPAPAFSGELLDGRTYDSSALAGKVTLVNFWASWCGPCRVESPVLQEVYAEHSTEGVTVLGVNVKDTRQEAVAFVSDTGLTYPSLFDPRAEVSLVFAGLPLRSPPVTIALDRAGRVAGVYAGELSKAQMTDTIDQLLTEPT